LEVPSDEFRLPFFKENGFVRKLCPSCGNHYWTQNPGAENCGDAPCVAYSFIGRSPVNRRLDIGEMREKFLSFFEARGHKRISPYPVIARWRDDLMVTIASIVDFQPYVTEGIIPPPANPLVVSQPCLRFEDIDLVGKTAGRHLTIFEMGGHHAFNYRDRPQVYWKDETVRFHHELLTRDLGVPSEKVTYKEGLWSGGGNAGFDLEGCVDGLEVSTLVFMMFRVLGDRLEPMPIQVVDTGYGMERWTWLSQGTPSAFHAVYGPLLDEAMGWAGLTEIDEKTIAEAARYSYLVAPEGGGRKRLANIMDADEAELDRLLTPVEGLYAALDHTKAMVFILSEGVVPSNVRQGYLARLLFRRSFRLLRRNGIEDRLPSLVEAQIDMWGRAFPQIASMRGEIMEMVAVEGEKYRDTLKRGSGLVKRTLRSSRKGIGIERLVEFYDSHGLTPEDVADVASEEGVDIAIPDDFYALVAKRHMKTEPEQAATTRAGLVEKIKGIGRTRTLFYEEPYLKEFTASVVAVVDGRYVVLDQTAFYAEGGGQISDLGWIGRGSERAAVTDVQSIEGVILHEVEDASPFEKGDRVQGTIDWERRHALMRSHTATHLILGAARRVLGDHAWQAGAQKGVEQSRIDVSHYQKLTQDQVEAIERLVNGVVAEGRPVTCRWMQRNDAEAKFGFRLYQGGAVPGKEIRVVDVGDWDVEACGGTHLRNTSEAGLIKIVNTERVQDGVERIVFAVGPHALSEVQRRERALLEVANLLGAPLERVAEAASNTVEAVKTLRHERDEYLQSASRQTAEKLLAEAREERGVKIVIVTVDERADFLIEVGNALVQRSRDVVAVMSSGVEPRIIIRAGEGALARGIHAGRLAREVAGIVGGGGGGDPHFGQSGGGDPLKFEASREKMMEIIGSHLH
jgi:alanyl-tRNA synthetase